MRVYCWPEKAKTCLKVYYCEPRKKKCLYVFTRPESFAKYICCLKGCPRSPASGCYRAGAEEEIMVEGDTDHKEWWGEPDRGTRALLQWGSICELQFVLPAFLPTNSCPENWLNPGEVFRGQAPRKRLGVQKAHLLSPFHLIFTEFLFFPICNVEGKR